MSEIVDLTECMSNVLANGTIQQKRNVLSKLGSNLVWNDVELNVHNDIAIQTLLKGIKRAREINPEFEPKNCVVYKGPNEKTDEFSPVFSTMLDMVAEIGTFWKLDPLATYLPNLKDGLYPVARPTSVELAEYLA